MQSVLSTIRFPVITCALVAGTLALLDANHRLFFVVFGRFDHFAEHYVLFYITSGLVVFAALAFANWRAGRSPTPSDSDPVVKGIAMLAAVPIAAASIPLWWLSVLAPFHRALVPVCAVLVMVLIPACISVEVVPFVHFIRRPLLKAIGLYSFVIVVLVSVSFYPYTTATQRATRLFQWKKMEMKGSAKSPFQVRILNWRYFWDTDHTFHIEETSRFQIWLNGRLLRICRGSSSDYSRSFWGGTRYLYVYALVHDWDAEPPARTDRMGDMLYLRDEDPPGRLVILRYDQKGQESICGKLPQVYGHFELKEITESGVAVFNWMSTYRESTEARVPLDDCGPSNYFSFRTRIKETVYNAKARLKYLVDFLCFDQNL